ncbi:tetratricopeptide repeat protein 1-like [Asterias rubens]|uniref:tetratricopeptide repeat protein 1-like n=1 Tax=Asterias rubens TaxID=7604 RepID=UPI001455AF38|nr:tetratricopeptide repeat protein 1-like [Asterias rubens]
MASEFESGFARETSPSGKTAPPVDESDSDDEFYDALAADNNAADGVAGEENAGKIVEDLIQSQLLQESVDIQKEDNFKEDEIKTDDSLSFLIQEEDRSELSEKEVETDPNRTCEMTRESDDAESRDGLGAEETEPPKEDEEDNGGIVSDDEGKKEMEEQMTEEDKQVQRAEAQTHKTQGNELFKLGEFADAVYNYSQALKLCPLCFKKDRSIMYANRAACKIRQERFESAIKDCNKALELNPVYLKVVLRRAQTYEVTDKLEDALKDYERAFELDPGCYEARAACMRLPDQIKERNEKLKEEMMSKLKDLGNLCLRPFGLSTNNFQLNQDPNTGSYSVNFSQNPGKTNGK